MARTPKISLWWCVIVAVAAVASTVAFNVRLPVAVAAFVQGGVTVLNLGGTALPRLAKGAEADLVDVAFPFSSISIPDGTLTIQGRLVRLEGGTLPPALDLTVRSWESDTSTAVITMTFPLAVDVTGEIHPQDFHVPPHTIPAGDDVVVAFTPRGSDLPLTRLDLVARFSPGLANGWIFPFFPTFRPGAAGR
jgi:hypothetical protein